MSKFINDYVVGIDVSSEFSVVAMLKPSGSLLEEVAGIDFLTAVTLIAEIGDFSKFHSPKAFVAFFGIVPSD